MASSGANLLGKRDEYDSGDEYSLDDEVYAVNQRTAQETKGWNVFREIPIKKESGSMETVAWIEVSVKFLKLLAYIVTFMLVLGSGVISKGTLLFMTSQIKKNRTITHCNSVLERDHQYVTRLPFEERIAWLWCILIAFSIPELATLFRSVRICFFKTTTKASPLQFLLVFIIETLHTIGIAVLLLFILPDLDAVKGVMLTNCVCFIPGILNALSRNNEDSKFHLKIVLDVLSLSAQVTGFLVWPLMDGRTTLRLIPLSCSFISLAWWENYVDKKSNNRVIKILTRLKEDIKLNRYHTYRMIAPWKIVVFLIVILISLSVNDDDAWSFFRLVPQAFSEREYNVTQVQMVIQDVQHHIVEMMETDNVTQLPISWLSPVWVTLIQVIAGYVCFVCAKYACKILIQGFSFALALNLVVPVAINILIILCGIRNANPCAFHSTIPDYLFFEIPPVYFLKDYLAKDIAWIWLLWLFSQMWITVHIWLPKCERLAITEKLFALPQYSGALVDQSMVLNRSKDDEVDVKFEDLDDIEDINTTIKTDKFYEPDGEFLNFDGSVANDVRPSDYVSRVYCCATMWHETKDEMIEFLKSIFRLDEDQSARRVAQKYLHVVDPDYYELEVNIFMDDAFEVSDHSIEDSQVNRFVKLLVSCIDEAASEVHLTNVRLRPPKKYPTPYGGRLEWTMPGKNKLICHLKDKAKIRHRKRWSQVMYMYYILGHRLMDLPISVDRKEVIASNTYLLALDGDIDFQPKAVTLLIDLMKKNKNLGAACGRIHPIGSGPMVWYQKFEYAIGHWLQKATEHMIGCVLCSPGCFSLFRGKALMDDNIMRKYTLNSSEARHYVQYDQGEDRWLCTLLLQRGYRVEYSAASDAYTHCPEGFYEFYNQRRRWVPSTMANILDLLTDAKTTVKVNDNISRLYIVYQFMLMAGTILGPGTIFLMLVGALVAAFGLSNWQALQINLIPVLIFLVICMTCKSETQLFFAGMITCFYGLLMMAVMLGIALQIAEDGWLAPSSVFFIATFGVFFITAALHPQEIGCLLTIMVYYITIPSMYMLLIIYSLCNMNNVTWGTREAPQKKTAKEMEAEKQQVEEAKKAAEKKSFLSILRDKTTDETKGSLELGVAGLFKCICCTNPNDHKEDMHLVQISSQLERLEAKMNSYHHMTMGTEPMDTLTRRKTSIALRGDVNKILTEYPESEVSTEIPREEMRDGLTDPYWIEDQNLEKGEVDFLSVGEIQFWRDLIEAYLSPIEEDKEDQARIAKDLKDLRDKMVFAFVMMNALFVLVIFLLQLNQDQLHIVWPFGQKLNLTYVESDNVVFVEQEYLQLEPIGMVFLVFFALVMVVQFTAMIMHRWVTITHLLSTTPLNWYCTREPSDQSVNRIIETNGVEIAKVMQRQTVAEADVNAPVGRRKTIRNLDKSRQSQPNMLNLGATFKKNLMDIHEGRATSILVDRRRSTLTPAMMNAVVNRRSSVMAAERRATLARASGALFDFNTPRMTVNQMTPTGGQNGYENSRPSAMRYNNRASVGVYASRQSLYGPYNQGFEPNIDSEEEEDRPSPITPQPSTSQFRKSVAFKDYNC